MEKKKIGFASSFGFIMAAAGSAVGLGNLWGFPYKTSANGGAAFVLLYIACVLFIGVTAMICEIFLGKRSSANPITAYKKISPKIGWFGLVAIVIPVVIMCYYSVLGGYTVRFAGASLLKNAASFSEFAANPITVSVCTLIFMGMSLFVVMSGVKGGIEKASKVLMPTLFLILVGIVIFALCQGKGVAEGLAYYLKPDFSEITFSSVLAAMGQAFYSLSIGMGALIVYGSYAGREINILKSTAMICIFDTLVALLSGLAIFPSLFHYVAETGVAAEKLGMGGVGLMFQTLPMVFNDMGVVGHVVSFFFFVMIIIAAITSVISLMEVASQFVIQKFHMARKKAAILVAVPAFIAAVFVGLSLGKSISGSTDMTVFGYDYLSFLDIVSNTVLMPVCAFISCITVGWLIGTKKATNEIEKLGTPLGWFKNIFVLMVKFITPALILIIEIFGLIDLIAPKTNGVRTFSPNGLGVVLTSYGLVVLCAIVYLFFFKNVETGCNDDEVTE